MFRVFIDDSFAAVDDDDASRLHIVVDEPVPPSDPSPVHALVPVPKLVSSAAVPASASASASVPASIPGSAPAQ